MATRARGDDLTAEGVRPPQRGWRYHLRNQTASSRAHLIASIGVNLLFFGGLIAVLSSYGWSQVCPPGVTRLECSPSDPLAAGLGSEELTAILWVAVIMATLIVIVGLLRYRRMPTRSSREGVIYSSVLATQPLILGLLLLWFQGTDVPRFARNFLNFSLIGQRAGIVWDDLMDDLPAILGTSAVWAGVAAALTAAYVIWRKHKRTPIYIAAIVGGIAGFVWAMIGLAKVPSFFKGAQNTLVLSAAGAAIGFGLGLILALFTMSRRAVVRAPARIYINFFRGTPLIWQIAFAGIGLVPALRLDLDMYTIAILVLGLNLAAYSSEVYRAGIQSLERGQIEAARTVGLSYFQSMRYVVVPQAIRRVIPPLLNEFVILVKDTSLVSVLGLTVAEKELLGIARDIYGTTFDATAWLGAAAGYLIITIPMIRVVNIIERRLRSGLTSVIG